MPVKKAATRMQCTVCKTVNYFTNKSKVMAETKLELLKFCNTCRKHTPHKESRK